eukprot:NODE_438_length_3049_cov_4.097878.p1 GENE.NODE_438_length_3049_cov_4.097878~~NODE_438_length_3049_cov_4.097878.p1  ORF type:complete len:976 (+),score=232.09 NODE_438_length_3049_cov_4.097878:220-2928(+)
MDAVDRYEARLKGDWLPAVIRNLLDGNNILVELYSQGSFWSEMVNRIGPVTVPAEDIRLRQWNIYRGEVLHVPECETLVLRAGQSLCVRARGPGADERAGRLVLGHGAGVRCEGGTVNNEGVLECLATLHHQQYGRRSYKMVIESIKTLLVDQFSSAAGVRSLPLEERSVVLQCITWVFERVYWRMRMRTLGGRGWYCADEGETYPRAREDHPHVIDRDLPPRVVLYRGFATSAVQVDRGLCLKVDLSARVIQGQTVLVRLNFLRDLLFDQHAERGAPLPTQDDMDAFLQMHLAGKTCMTMHNHLHYRIKRVCLDTDPTSPFQSEDGETTYLEYFQKRHDIALQRRQPMLHCPFRCRQDLHLPAELAYLTGVDDDSRSDRTFTRDLWRSLRHDPMSHWRGQAELTERLSNTEQTSTMQEWGISVDRTPLRVPCAELAHEPVYFSRCADAHFRRGVAPPPELQVQTLREGFARRPWPEVWTRAGRGILLDRWVVFCDVRQQDERDAVARFIDNLEVLVGEVIKADAHSGRIQVARPEVVEVVGPFSDFMASYQPPWPREELKFVVVVISSRIRRRDQYYYNVKNMLSFEQARGVMSQMVRMSTLQRQTQREEVCKNILQQILVKRGAWLWVLSPLPYRGRIIMVVGIDSHREFKNRPLVQTLCASTNPYFTTYFTTWRSWDSTNTESCVVGPAEPLTEAMHQFFAVNRRLPDTVIIYRGGVSDSQEANILEQEVYHPQNGVLAAILAVSEEKLGADELKVWKERFEVAYILVRRGTNARFKTEEDLNVPGGTCIESDIVTCLDQRDDVPQRWEFYMVSQSYMISTAKPTLYTILSSTLSMSRLEIKQCTYRLCSLYMTFCGSVSMPAPLKYAAKLLSFLTKCQNAPSEPLVSSDDWRTYPFFL